MEASEKKKTREKERAREKKRERKRARARKSRGANTCVSLLQVCDVALEWTCMSHALHVCDMALDLTCRHAMARVWRV